MQVLRDTTSVAINKNYAVGVIGLTFVLPLLCFFFENLLTGSGLTFANFGKWFIFFAIGWRLFLAGLKQSIDPSFTAKQIFRIENEECFPIVRELGFANICFGVLGLASFFIPSWRVVSALVNGIYYGAAGFQHLIKKPASANEKLALWTDLVAFAILVLYLINSL